MLFHKDRFPSKGVRGSWPYTGPKQYKFSSTLGTLYSPMLCHIYMTPGKLMLNKPMLCGTVKNHQVEPLDLGHTPIDLNSHFLKNQCSAIIQRELWRNWVCCVWTNQDEAFASTWPKKWGSNSGECIPRCKPAGIWRVCTNAHKETGWLLLLCQQYWAQCRCISNGIKHQFKRACDCQRGERELASNQHESLHQQNCCILCWRHNCKQARMK